MQEIETVVVKNVQHANRTVEQELGRFEKIISAFEKYIDNQINDMKEHNKAYFDQVTLQGMNQGGDHTQKNDDMQTTINLISRNIAKVDEDGRDRIQLLREELKANQAAITQQLIDVQNKVAVDDSTL